MSRARDGWELVGGTLRRLYSKEVGGRGPGPRRRAGAMAEAHDAARRQEPGQCLDTIFDAKTNPRS